ncbi:hypothetical protein PC123_g16688 [Phytophthora cactorum]|nr:hypothetical protein PC120_g16521 [Phytophthora cactorum]KAG4047961.1 hypothetical protein PC123_g16688 [Phytophthora cactorum]
MRQREIVLSVSRMHRKVHPITPSRPHRVLQPPVSTHKSQRLSQTSSV